MGLTEEQIAKAQQYNEKVEGWLWRTAELTTPELVGLAATSAEFAEAVAALQAEESLKEDGKLGSRTLHALAVRAIDLAHEADGPRDLGWWTIGEAKPTAEALLDVAEPWHDESLDHYLDRMGIAHWNAHEVTRLHQWGVNVEPLRADWSHIVPTARIAELLRHALGDHKLVTVHGYRPRRYNTAVGGVANSQHMAFRSLLLSLDAPQADDEGQQRRLYEEAAKLFVEYGEALKMGIGFYVAERSSRISLDTGFRRRTWRADHVEKVIEDLGLPAWG